jgi:hypothetical protein
VIHSVATSRFQIDLFCSLSHFTHSLTVSSIRSAHYHNPLALAHFHRSLLLSSARSRSVVLIIAHSLNRSLLLTFSRSLTVDPLRSSPHVQSFVMVSSIRSPHFRTFSRSRTVSSIRSPHFRRSHVFVDPLCRYPHFLSLSHGFVDPLSSFPHVFSLHHSFVDPCR